MAKVAFNKAGKVRNQTPKETRLSSGPKTNSKRARFEHGSSARPEAKSLKANTKTAARSISTSGSKGSKPKAMLRQPIKASKGDITGGMGKKRKREVESSDDDSGSENDGEDERESDDDADNDADGADDDDDNEKEGDDLEGVSASGFKKTSKKNTEESMAEAMSKILGSTLRKADASTPILARSRGVERKLEEEKMEAKARKAINSEKKRLANKDRVKPDYTGMEYEKKLRKVATRGVVQLFNAIKAQQKATEELTEKTRPITTNDKDKVANLTKASFLDLLKSGAKVSTV
ncbi:MAG: Rrp15p-domain-containing protein [Benniella sp.]|nr:MAG: Rrp15p-domain-containing protein [Benniella sp.]